jgi:hypothetical protein
MKTNAIVRIVKTINVHTSVLIPQIVPLINIVLLILVLPLTKPKMDVRIKSLHVHMITNVVMGIVQEIYAKHTNVLILQIVPLINIVLLILVLPLTKPYMDVRIQGLHVHMITNVVREIAQGIYVKNTNATCLQTVLRAKFVDQILAALGAKILQSVQMTNFVTAIHGAKQLVYREVVHL